MNMFERNQKQIEKMEKLEDGQHMVDFEQMKIENQTLQEKIDDRKDEIEKLNSKILSFVEVMTHLREKLNFEREWNKKEKKNFDELSKEVYTLRKTVKNKRDKLQEKQKKSDAMKLELGIVNNKKLMTDMTKMKDKKLGMEDLLLKLQEQHSLLKEFLTKAQKVQGIDLNQKISAK
mmetsp:Transcript_76601/g.165761  ORF Transcript_76601/g.165761 Transcript_76601/m.165761 type:complete len:176 (+) Transcript_76601:292-819(+)